MFRSMLSSSNRRIAVITAVVVIVSSVLFPFAVAQAPMNNRKNSGNGISGSGKNGQGRDNNGNGQKKAQGPMLEKQDKQRGKDGTDSMGKGANANAKLSPSQGKKTNSGKSAINLNGKSLPSGNTNSQKKGATQNGAFNSNKNAGGNANGKPIAMGDNKKPSANGPNNKQSPTNSDKSSSKNMNAKQLPSEKNENKKPGNSKQGPVNPNKNSGTNSKPGPVQNNKNSKLGPVHPNNPGINSNLKHENVIPNKKALPPNSMQNPPSANNMKHPVMPIFSGNGNMDKALPGPTLNSNNVQFNNNNPGTTSSNLSGQSNNKLEDVNIQFPTSNPMSSTISSSSQTQASDVNEEAIISSTTVDALSSILNVIAPGLELYPPSLSNQNQNSQFSSLDPMSSTVDANSQNQASDINEETIISSTTTIDTLSSLLNVIAPGLELYPPSLSNQNQNSQFSTLDPMSSTVDDANSQNQAFSDTNEEPISVTSFDELDSLLNVVTPGLEVYSSSHPKNIHNEPAYLQPVSDLQGTIQLQAADYATGQQISSEVTSNDDGSQGQDFGSSGLQEYFDKDPTISEPGLLESVNFPQEDAANPANPNPEDGVVNDGQSYYYYQDEGSSSQSQYTPTEEISVTTESIWYYEHTVSPVEYDYDGDSDVANEIEDYEDDNAYEKSELEDYEDENAHETNEMEDYEGGYDRGSDYQSQDAANSNDAYYDEDGRIDDSIDNSQSRSFSDSPPPKSEETEQLSTFGKVKQTVTSWFTGSNSGHSSKQGVGGNLLFLASIFSLFHLREFI